MCNQHETLVRSYSKSFSLHTKSEIRCVVFTHSTHQFGPATFSALDGYMWLVATILDSIWLGVKRKLSNSMN